MTRDPKTFKLCIDLMTEHIQNVIQKAGATDPVIIGLDARGFIFGPLVAQNICAPFVPIRKGGKLPGEVLEVKYSLEYGEVRPIW